MNKEIFLSPKEFIDIITVYYSVKERRHFDFFYQLDIIDNGITKEPSIQIFHSCFIKGEYITVKLRENEILEPLTIYTHNKGFELINYKYVGGVRNTGYFTDTEIPVFEGVMLNVKKLTKPKTRKK